MRLAIIALFLAAAGVNAFAVPHGGHRQHGQVGKYSGHRQHGQWSQRQHFHKFKREDADPEVVISSDNGTDEFTTEAHGMHGQSGKVILRPGHGFHGQHGQHVRPHGQQGGFHGQHGHGQQFHHLQKRDHDDFDSDAEWDDGEIWTESNETNESNGEQLQKRDDGPELEAADDEFTTESHGHRQRQWGKGGHRQHGQQRHFQKRDDGAESAVAEVEAGDDEFITESHGHRQRQWGKGTHRQHGQRIHRRGGGGGNRHKKEEKEHKKEQKKIEKKYKKGHDSDSD
ncbi:hypothetical protein HK102_011068 [Quaeritorhiza haematococci]|nr:hypothetical protein HK102_011068 [Quaeritorhiza haematococci]